MAGTENAVQRWVDCFPRCALGGTVFAGGVNGAGEIAGQRARTASLGSAHERTESAGGGGGEENRVCRMKPQFVLSIHPNMI